MSVHTLNSDQANAICAFLEVQPGKIGLEQLDTLIAAYVRRVPWESASRIVSHAQHPTPAACVRWPETFWQEAITQGTGGTCFESNYALFKLLTALGYEGYLTINDMHDVRACHTAIIIELAEGSFLVDAGMPFHVAIPFKRHEATERVSLLHTYRIRPEMPGRYLIERDRHPSPYCFTLIDQPVSIQDYEQAVINDYGPNGFFLNRVVINKLVDEKLYRFSSDTRPYQIERFNQEERLVDFIDYDPEGELARLFGIDTPLIAQALSEVQSQVWSPRP